MHVGELDCWRGRRGELLNHCCRSSWWCALNCGVGKWGGWWPYCCRSWCIVVSTIGRTHGFLGLKDAGLPRKHRQYVGFLVRGVVEQLFVGAGVVRWGWWLWWLCSSMQARSWQIESCRHQEVHPAFGQVGWSVCVDRMTWYSLRG